MTDAVFAPADARQTTLVEELVLEVLTARWRTGEQSWTFVHRSGLKKALRALEEDGLILWKQGGTEKTYLVSFTGLGRNTYLDENYTPGSER